MFWMINVKYMLCSCFRGFISMACAENEYYYNGECRVCPQCAPGHQLLEECSYGSGGDARCGPCHPRSYKEDWGHHNCRLCTSCSQLNRQQTSPCTARKNTVCGECLPGFYSKMRIDGTADLECMPCGLSSASESQCTRHEAVDAGKDVNPETLLHNAAVPTAICGAVTVTIVLSLLVFVYFRRASLKKVFKGCSGSRHRAVAVTAIRNGDTLTQNLEKEVQVSAPFEVPSVEDFPAALKSCLQTCGFSEVTVATHQVQSRCSSSSSEMQPLMRNSSCSHCSSESYNMPEDGSHTEEPPPPPQLDGYCASDKQGEHRHAPVECTETDFQNSLNSDGSTISVKVGAPIPTVDSSAENMPSVPPAQPAERASDSHQQPCSSCSTTVPDILMLTRKSCAQMQGVHLGKLPQALVDTLALKLDSSFPAVKNYQQVALDLGIPPEVVRSLEGFNHVFHYLSSCTLRTVPDLINTFYRLQRFDTLLLLCEYAAQSRHLNTSDRQR
ncbi:tumor necrosis factor receptor superfamily member 27 isoform X1 [Scleropages formosus]|uniref:TNFR-Cys domain-containing protein n=2 Tax=Scleropages formosus TaxID=113540 RepID=A0A8C9RIV5_SCLFO|nr:tumor necrosis factor receptor superfamily member 27 isoform X1 [Scleropages formosus]